MKFNVLITVTFQEEYNVEAEDEAQAEEKALDIFHNEVPVSNLDSFESNVQVEPIE